jgi:hypothetical protein
MYNKLERTTQEAVYFEILSWQLPKVTEENHQKPVRTANAPARYLLTQAECSTIHT